MKQVILLPFILFCSVANGQCIRINGGAAVECSFGFSGIKSRAETPSYEALKTAKNPPIYIVDGVITEEVAIKKLNPDNIETISILKKDITKFTLCHQSLNDAIVIVTKKTDQRVISVRDMLSGEALPGASVEIISTQKVKNTLYLIADSFGRVMTNKMVPGKEYEIRVSSVGYKPHMSFLDTTMTGKNYLVTLERNYLEATETPVVSATVCRLRKVICYASQKITECPILEKTRVNASDKFIAPENLPQALKIFPNPVMRSQKTIIEFENKSESKIIIRVLSLDNKLVTEREYNVNEGTNRISHLIDSRVAAGVYIVRVIDKTNRSIRSGKIIVQ